MTSKFLPAPAELHCDTKGDVYYQLSPEVTEIAGQLAEMKNDTVAIDVLKLYMVLGFLDLIVIKGRSLALVNILVSKSAGIK